MTVRPLARLTFASIVAVAATFAPAQSAGPTPAPFSPAPAGGKPVTIPMGRDWAIDAPATWTRVPDFLIDKAFTPRTDASVIGALQHIGQRPTDVPYVIVEQIYPDTGMDSVAGRQGIAERIADHYRTAVNPPSKADRSPSWRRSKVTPIQYDPASGQFRFDATLTYDSVGDLHVVVSGLFDRERVMVLSGWSDAAFDVDHPNEMSSLRDSMRLVGLSSVPVVSPGASLRTIAQVVVGFFVLVVIVLQVVVLHRDRRARRGEDFELI